MSPRKSTISQLKGIVYQVLKKHRHQQSQLSETRPEMAAGKGEQQQLSVAILGAGIGGLALAIGLIRRGVSCTVYDACEEFSAVGAGIGLGPNSLEAMELIDPRFRARYESVKTGNERPEFEHSAFDALYAEEGFGEKRGWTRGLVGAPYFTRSSAHRKDLLEIMESFIPIGTVKFSKRVERIRQTGDKVRVKFADGDTITVDTVIGCDGVKGLTRAAVLRDIAPDAIAPGYANTYTYRGIISMKDAKEVLGHHGGDAKWFMAKGKGVVLYPISKGMEENFIFFVHDPNRWAGDHCAVDCTKEEMLADLEGFDPRLLKLLDWAKPLRWPILHHRSTPTYCNGRICLLGDVAHATSPHQAAGAGQCLEDVVVLAQLISLVKRRDQLETAFEVYDSIRRPRATEVVETSQEAGMIYTFLDPWIGDDIQKVVNNANARLHWIWQHDIRADQKKAEEEFLRRVRGQSKASTKRNVSTRQTGNPGTAIAT